MRIETSDLRLPATIGLAVTVPFLILELVSYGANEAMVITPEYLLGITLLFAILWALPTGFIVVLRPILTGSGSRASRLSILIRLAALVLIAWFWAALVVDQWPCFIGVPNCD